MIKTYKIDGMTCGGCVAKVKSALEEIPHLDVPEAKYSTWGTIGVKYLMGEAGEGCYD